VRVGAVILAAGSSSRLGTPKQLLEFGGRSLVRNAVLAAIEAPCAPVVVVTGASAEPVAKAVEGLGVQVAWNARWETGMASSINSGIASLLETDATVAAAVLLVCDQPLVTAQVIEALVAAHHKTGCIVVASSYAGSVGVPALFGRELFDELTHLDGTAGAKAVIARHASEAHFVPFPDGEMDVDTPEDYARLRAREHGSREWNRVPAE
jgi:molybdenum cofactor cytidylyltransferase